MPQKQHDSPLRTVRRARQMTQKQLAMIVRVSHQTISKAERRILNLTFDKQELIATILGASRSELFPPDDSASDRVAS